MRTIRHLLAGLVLVAACFATLPARASLGTNFTDQWWVPTESGWGASIHQQYDVMFVILFVQGPDTRPVWYAGPAYYQYNTGMPVFTGDLYQTNGPWYGGTFNPDAATERKVGTVTFAATSVDTGTLTYSVDGVVVTKGIERQLWAYEDFTGEYYGGLDYSSSGCSDPTTNGYFEQFGPVHVDHALVNWVTLVAQTGHRQLHVRRDLYAGRPHGLGDRQLRLRRRRRRPDADLRDGADGLGHDCQVRRAERLLLDRGTAGRNRARVAAALTR